MRQYEEQGLKPNSVYGYNAEGKQHRIAIEHIQWLEAELREAKRLQTQFDREAMEADYADYEGEIARHEQDGFAHAIGYVLLHFENLLEDDND